MPTPQSPVILQTFGEASARTLAAMKIGVPVVLLVDAATAGTGAGQGWKGVVQGLGPAKGIILKSPAFVQWAHEAGLTVTPYTFRSPVPARSRPSGRDGALPLHARRRRPLHRQPRPVPAALNGAAAAVHLAIDD